VWPGVRSFTRKSSLEIGKQRENTTNLKNEAPSGPRLSRGREDSGTRGSVMSPVTRSQTRSAREAKKEERATEEGLKWAPTPSQFDFTIEAKEGEMVRCHKKILKEKCTFFKDSLKKSSKRFKVCYDVRAVKALLDYFYNNNTPAATPELWQMSLELGADDLTSDLAQRFSKCPSDEEIWRLVFLSENYEVAMWVKNLALENLMKAYFGPDIDSVYSSPKKIEKFFRYVYGDLFDDPHAADDVRSIAHGRATAKLRLIQAKQQPNQKELKVALKVVNMCCHEC